MLLLSIVRLLYSFSRKPGPVRFLPSSRLSVLGFVDSGSKIFFGVFSKVLAGFMPVPEMDLRAGLVSIKFIELFKRKLFFLIFGNFKALAFGSEKEFFSRVFDRLSARIYWRPLGLAM